MSDKLTPQHLFADALARVQAICAALAAEGQWPAGIDFSRVVVEPPRDASHGDMATNAAMVLAKDAKAKPRELADKIAEKLRADDLVASVEVAGPGFINLTLKPQVWADELRTDAARGCGLRQKRGRPRRQGQCRIRVGQSDRTDACRPLPRRGVRRCAVRPAAILRATTSRANITSTTPAHRSTCSRVPHSCATAKRSARASAKSRKGSIPATTSCRSGSRLAAEHGDKLKAMSESAWLPIVRAKAVAMMMDMIKGDLAALNIKHDVFFSERSLVETGNNKVTETIDFLRAKGDIYEGRLPPPKGKPVEDYEDRIQTLFRATAYGDDVDRPLIKSDGAYTYFASDIAYHKNKVDRGFLDMIDVFGADHGGYVERVQAAVKGVSSGKAALDIKLVQLVRLLRAGEPVKMSKRSGDFVTLREVVDEVGSDAVRFMMLFRKNDAVLDFDLAKVLEQSKDNPVFYVQYGHARGHSIFKNAREVVPELPKDDAARSAWLEDAPVALLTDPAELALLKRLALYPRMIEAAAVAHEPHRIAFYLYDLASEFHALWTKGRDLPYLRFIITNDAEITRARLAMVQGVVSVLASGLAVLGVHAPTEMR